MSIVVVDYAFSHPTVTELKNDHVTAVGRYFGQDVTNDGKNLTPAEAKALAEAGIDIFGLYEYGAAQSARGANQGAADVTLGTKQAKECGMPMPRPIYFAVDYDIPDYAPHLPNDNDPAHALAKLGPVGEYFTVVRRELGASSGAYGGYWAIKRLFDARLISWGMQASAWSGGMWESRAQLRQNGTTAFGGAVDLDTPERSDFGQWRSSLATTTPPPTPPPTWKTTVARLLGEINSTVTQIDTIIKDAK